MSGAASAPRREGRARLVVLAALVVPGVLFFFVGVPLLAISQTSGGASYDGIADGTVDKTRGGSGTSGSGVCTYHYRVHGTSYSEWDFCATRRVHVGDRVTVHYRTASPSRSWVWNRTGTKNVGSYVIAGVVWAVGLGYVVHYLRRWRRRRRLASAP